MELNPDFEKKAKQAVKAIFPKESEQRDIDERINRARI